MSDDKTAETVDQWLRAGKQAPRPIPIGRQRSALRATQQHNIFELLSRIDDLKTEVRWERERADRLDVERALLDRALRLTRREETLKLRDRAGLAAFGFLVAVGVWGNLIVLTR